MPNPCRDASEPYFSRARTDALELLPTAPARVLEIGCGSGATLAELRRRFPGAYLAGVELFADAAAKARSVADEVLTADIEQETLPFAEASFDAILCLDVLEHLRDPWTVVARLKTLLRPGGVLIASLPNIQHWSVWLPLALAGRWRYVDEGILDRTHLRFFTRESAAALLAGAGLRVDRICGTGTGVRGRFFRRTNWRPGTGWFAFNYLVRGVSAGPRQ